MNARSMLRLITNMVHGSRGTTHLMQSPIESESPERQRRVLLVEDEPSISGFFRRVLIFEGFLRVQGAMQTEAQNSAAAVAGQIDPATLGQSAGAERWTLVLVLAVAMANVALGIWRPRLSSPPKPAGAKPTTSKQIGNKLGP